MRFHDAIESYVRDQWGNGKFTSRQSERDYRATLGLLAAQVSNRDPKLVSRSDVKAVLDRWTHPNTRGAKRSHMVSFFKWAMGEGLVKSNPALQRTHPSARARSTIGSAARRSRRYWADASQCVRSASCTWAYSPDCATSSCVACEASTSLAKGTSGSRRSSARGRRRGLSRSWTSCGRS